MNIVTNVHRYCSVLQQPPAAPVVSQNPVALGAVETQNKRMVPSPKSFQSKHRTRDSWWIQPDGNTREFVRPYWLA